MKFVPQLLITALTVALVSALSDDGYDRVTCTDRLNTPEFIPECIELYCRCMFACDNPDYATMTLDADGKPKKTNKRKKDPDMTVTECFKKNGCDPKEDLEKLIPCTNCIMEQPEETVTCKGYQIGKVAQEKNEVEAEAEIEAKTE